MTSSLPTDPGQPPSPSTRPSLRIIFDGGARGNPGPGYGSYQIVWANRPPVLRRVEFGPRLTSNEAEYLALIHALDDAVALVEASGMDSASVHVEVRGDSQLVLKQVAGEWKVRAPHLQRFRDTAWELLQRFGGFTLTWQPRSQSVRILGH